MLCGFDMSGFPISIGRRERKSRGVYAANVLLIILLIILVWEMMFVSRYTRVYVVGDSMLPTLQGAQDKTQAGGDFLYADTHATAENGDIIVISAHDEFGEEKVIIKRQIAFEGQTVQLVRGVLYIDGEMVEEPYVVAENNTASLPVNTYGPVTVPEGCVFVMGDNRDVSSDSRSKYGMIDTEDIIGVVAPWSLALKGFITSWNTFFEYTVPAIFSGCGAR